MDNVGTSDLHTDGLAHRHDHAEIGTELSRFPGVRAVAEKLAKGPTKSYALIRQGIRDCLDVSLSEGLMVERRNQLLAGRSADFVEGVSAFLQKRPAAFTGK